LLDDRASIRARLGDDDVVDTAGLKREPDTDADRSRAGDERGLAGFNPRLG
jgi:hypothetical protein